jgi:hypothetical protein
MCNKKECLKFYVFFMFSVFPILAKFTYRWSSLEQHHKIEKEHINSHTITNHFYFIYIFVLATHDLLII